MFVTKPPPPQDFAHVRMVKLIKLCSTAMISNVELRIPLAFFQKFFAFIVYFSTFFSKFATEIELVDTSECLRTPILGKAEGLSSNYISFTSYV